MSAVSIMMEDTSANTLDPYDEVRKLKDLVRKLELQNQQLRKKHETPRGCNQDINIIPPNTRKSTATVPKTPVNKDHKDSSRSAAAAGRDLTLDEIELINVDDIDLSDEDSWLYSSPTGLTPEQKSLSPYEWLRKDLEDPERRELQLAKRALVNKLDELAILSPECTNQAGNNRILPWTESKSPYGQYNKSVDTRTFTRPKKKRSSPPYSNDEGDAGSVLEHTEDDDADDQDTDVSASGSLDGSLLSSIHSYNDVSDVQEIARLQEESLRQSTVVTPKRSSENDNPRRLSMGSSASSTSESDMTLAFDDKVSCTVSSPVGGHHVTNLNISNHSSPPGTPRGSSSPLGSSKDKLRRSLPNLLKGYNGVKPLQGKHASDSKLQRPTQSRSSSARPESRIQPPSRIQAPQVPRELSSQGFAARSSPSPPSSGANHHQLHLLQHHSLYSNNSPATPAAAAPSSSTPIHHQQQQQQFQPIKPNSLGNPNLKGSRSHLAKSQKSGLPRPSKIPGPRSRSGIPVPSRHPELKPQYNGDDDSWSDGCY